MPELNFPKTPFGKDPVYDMSKPTIPVTCPGCGHPTGEVEYVHAAECPCQYCEWERRMVTRIGDTSSGKKITFRKFSGIS